MFSRRSRNYKEISQIQFLINNFYIQQFLIDIDFQFSNIFVFIPQIYNIIKCKIQWNEDRNWSCDYYAQRVNKFFLLFSTQEQTEPGGGIAPAGWSVDLEPKAKSGSVRRDGGNVGPSLARCERAFGTSKTNPRLECIVPMVRIPIILNTNIYKQSNDKTNYTHNIY